MSSSLYLIPLPSPAFGFAEEETDPAAAAREALALAQVLRDHGQRCLILPPPDCPDDALLEAYRISSPAALPKEAPWLLQRCWSPQPWAASMALAQPGRDRADGCDQLLLTSDGLCAVGQRDLRRSIDRLLGQPALAAPPALAGGLDRGQANHFRLANQQRALHGFCHQRSLDMPAALLPRKLPPRQDKEAQALASRGLLPGSSLFVARDWRAIDAEAGDACQVICAGGQRLLTHERALLDQGLVIEACERIIPELRSAVVPNNRLSLREAAWYGGFCGLMLTAGERHVLCTATHAQAHKGTRRCYERWLKQGLIDDLVTTPCEHLDPRGGPGRIALDCGPGWAAVTGHGDDTLSAVAAAIGACYDIRPQAALLADPAFAEHCRVQIAKLRDLILPPHP